ncbi:S8 family serine peptidase [Halogeometricum borinquense]|uniref:S8 family serine peptidase n=1 Tax=Halogeometricum borinquense TaxID=60847 RepID=UPI00342D2559
MSNARSITRVLALVFAVLTVTGTVAPAVGATMTAEHGAIADEIGSVSGESNGGALSAMRASATNTDDSSSTPEDANGETTPEGSDGTTAPEGTNDNSSAPDGNGNSAVPDGTDENTTTPDSPNGNATTPDGGNDTVTTPDGTDDDTTTPDGTNDNATTPDGTNNNSTTPDGTDSNATTPDGTNDNATTPDGTDNNATTPDGTDDNATTPDGTGAATPSANSTDGTNSTSAGKRTNETQTNATAANRTVVESWAANASSSVEVIVRVEEFEVPTVSTMSQETVVEKLKTHAETSQQPVIDYAESTDGVTVLNRYWLTNALLLRVDTAKTNASKLVGQPGVTGIHKNFEVRALSSAERRNNTTASGATTASTPATTEVTYGLDQLNVPAVWAKHGTKGAGAKVAVLDTGIDVGHPDLELYTEDPGNDTYPGGWAEFDTNGDRVTGSTPHATSGHGTHVSGTVAGGTASGKAIGVAPDADMMHGLVLPDGTGSFAQIIGGMQWAVEEDADVISMSLGADGFYSTLVTPIRNAEDAGTVVVAAAGNHGPETAPSPGSIYDSITVGASGPNRDIAPFSSGDVVRTERDWGDAAPPDWPDEYVMPDIAAPGVDTYSTLPGGKYGEKSGTSMATPHVSGVVALMVSASGGDASPEEIRTALRKSATKPDDAPSKKDIRYGNGIIDALDATTAVAAEQGISGSISNTGGEPLSGASIRLGSGAETATDANGDYLIRTLSGTYNTTVSEFGYASSTATVTVTEGSMTTHDVSLKPALAAEITSSQTGKIKAGTAASVTYRTAHAEALTVSRTGDTNGNATLYINGKERAFGESVSINASDDTRVQVRVETEAGSTGTLSLKHTISGLGETTTFTTGPTEIVSDPTYVTVVDSTGSEYAEQIRAAIEANVPREYFVSIISPREAMANTDEYDVFVVHQVNSNVNLQSFVEATSGPETGVVYLDQWGAASNGITALSEATQNPVVTGQTTETDQPTYEVVANHSIFDGIAARGESITIHNQSRGDIAWFERFRGTTLAVASDNGADIGTGVAIDESKQTVLLSSLGRTSTVQNRYVNEDADALLGNAVTYVNSLPPAWLESSQPKHVTPGESFAVDVAADDLRRLNVTLADSMMLSESDLALSINGTEREFGESYDINDSADSVTVTVNTSTGIVGTVGLSIAAESSNDTVELLSGETAVYEKPLVVPEDVKTIQRAVNLAPAGTTVEVANGTYTNRVTITTPGITLTAHDEERPTIDTRVWGFYDPVVHVDAPNVTVEHLNVVADGIAPDGIAVERSNATIRHVSVSGTSHGVLIGGAGSTADDAVVHDVNISDGADLLAIGVTVGEADNAHVYNATISGQDSGADVYTSSGTVIENSTITDSGAGLTTFETDNVRFVGNEIHDMDESATNTVGIQLEAFVTSATIEDNEIWNLSEGIYVEGTNTGGEIVGNDIDTEYGVWVERGDAPAIEIKHNDLAATNVSVGNGLDGSLRATMNYHGERSGNESFVSGDVTYEPFLTAPPEDVDTDTPQQIGVDLTLEAGNVYGVSVPGTTRQTVSDLFDDEFRGVVYGFDANDQSWTQLSGDDEIAALQGLAVVAESDGRMTVTHFVGSNQPSAPSQRTLTEGWNFVGSPEYGDLESGLNVETVDPGLAMAPFDAPSSQPGSSSGFDGVYRFDGTSTPPDVSAYEGYFVFVEEESTLPSYVVPNPSATELYEGIGLYPINASANASATTNGTVSVDAVLSRTDEMDRAAARLALSQLIYRDLNSAVRGEKASQRTLNETADAIIADAPDEHEALVANATADALERIRGNGTETGEAGLNEQADSQASNATAASITG